MPRLEVDNGFSKDIPGSGKIRPFRELSPKRITRCVRETLREEYGKVDVLVECFADFKGEIWEGSCRINWESHIYRVYQ